MSENSKIEWTDHTFNPWIGCTKVSPGCAHCYAETRDRRHLQEKVYHWGPGAPRYRTSASTWKGPLAWARRPFACVTCGEMGGACMGNSLDGFGAWCEKCQADTLRRRPRVFCASLADWLDDDGVPIEWLADLLRLIHDTRDLDWLLLTKRPQNWAPRIEEVLKWIEAKPEWDSLAADHADVRLRNWLADWFVLRKAPNNVWIGTTVEDQTRADERIPELVKIPARVRFLSCEPLLEAVIFKKALCRCKHDCDYEIVTDNPTGHFGNRFAYTDGARASVYCPKCGYALRTDARIDWVIAGGESGDGARPMHPDWARGLRDQCAGAGVAFFFKQWGEWGPIASVPRCDEVILDCCGKERHGCPHITDTIMYRVGKKEAGRLLDGVEHSAWPDRVNAELQTGEGATL